MSNGIFSVPFPENDPIRSYAPGTRDKEILKKRSNSPNSLKTSPSSLKRLPTCLGKMGHCGGCHFTGRRGMWWMPSTKRKKPVGSSAPIISKTTSLGIVTSWPAASR